MPNDSAEQLAIAAVLNEMDNEILSLESIADHFHLSIYYLARQFKKPKTRLKNFANVKVCPSKNCPIS